LRANTTIRTTSQFDYQPDVCKDYKETGFCGFGDTCIFMHDRGGDPKASQLEDEWEKKKKKREEEQEEAMRVLLCQVAGEDPDAKQGGERKGDKDLPFACNICRSAFADPVVTQCGHYFCSKCVGERYRKEGACPVCSKDLGGSFSRPVKLLRKKKGMGMEGATWEEFRKACQERKDGEKDGGGEE
jgi:RING finger protein 113A